MLYLPKKTKLLRHTINTTLKFLKHEFLFCFHHRIRTCSPYIPCWWLSSRLVFFGAFIILCSYFFKAAIEEDGEEVELWEGIQEHPDDGEEGEEAPDWAEAPAEPGKSVDFV